jgi:hypothetical protein
VESAFSELTRENAFKQHIGYPDKRFGVIVVTVDWRTVSGGRDELTGCSHISPTSL